MSELEETYRGCDIMYTALREVRGLPPYWTPCVSGEYFWTVEEVRSAIDDALGPISEGEFRFDSWSPPLDTREIFIVGAAWPAEVRTVDVGEDVYAHYVVKNFGTGAGEATITVKDLDTGAVVTTWSLPELAPSERFKTSGSGAYIGKMPSRDWRLEFKVTP